MPARRKPDHLKALTGTLRADRAAPPSVQLPAPETAPEPPPWLKNAHAIAEWRRLVTTLLAHQLLTEASLGAFSVCCAVYGEIVSLLESGEAPKPSLLTAYRTLANDFGLTALGMQKIQPPPPPKQRNPFADLDDAGFSRWSSKVKTAQRGRQ